MTQITVKALSDEIGTPVDRLLSNLLMLVWQRQAQTR